MVEKKKTTLLGFTVLGVSAEIKTPELLSDKAYKKDRRLLK